MGFNIINNLENIHVISEGSYFEPKKEIYLVECEGGLILIDVGEKGLFIDLIDEKLKELNKSWDEIKLIVFTCLNVKEIYNLEQIKKRCNPEIMLSFEDSKVLVKNSLINYDMELDEGDMIGACGGLEVIKIKNNSYNGLCFLFNKQKILIVGKAFNNLNFESILNNQGKTRFSKNFTKILRYDFNILIMNDGNRYAKKK